MAWELSEIHGILTSILPNLDCNSTKNYRATAELVAASNSLASHFVERREKALTSVSNDNGEIHIFRNKDEVHEGKNC